VQLEALRDAYVERFGALFDAREVTDERGRRPPFWLLTFWDAEVPIAPVVYATCGAPGREVYAVAVVPMFALSEAVAEAALSAPQEPASCELVRVQVSRTPFYGFLVAPAEDGSFIVEGERSDRTFVHRLVPVTRAERVLAADEDCRQAYRRVREAGALVADPLRDCTITPRDTKRWRENDTQGFVMVLREHLAKVDQRLAILREQGDRSKNLAWYEREAPQVRACLRHFEAGLPPFLTDDELIASVLGAPPDARLVRLVEVLVARGLEAQGHVSPPPIRADMTELATVVLTTHPEALRIVEALLDEPILPPVTEGSEAIVRATSRRVLAFVGALHPEWGRRKLESRVRRGIERARQTFRLESEIPYENHTWACMAEALYEGTGERAGPPRFWHAIDTARILEVDPSAAPPFQRLVKIVSNCTMSVFLEGAMMGMREMDN
jgi:hypothetical protein